MLHFPLAYLNWPYTTHAAQPRVRQIDRDWMWYESWGRAAWNPHRPEETQRSYWLARLGEFYGADKKAAASILDASEAAGEVMPLVTRALSNQPWNIQSHMLGQTMQQTLTTAGRWYAPPGETIAQFARKETAGKPHEGETPIAAAKAVRTHGNLALEHAKKAAPLVTHHKEQFERWMRDIEITRAVGDFYSEKTLAAIEVHLYFNTRDATRLRAIEKHLEDSLGIYRKLVQLTDGSYTSVGGWDACQQIPFRHPITHWKQVLPRLEQELTHFRRNAQYLRDQPLASGKIKPYLGVEVKVRSEGCEPFQVNLGARPFAEDTPWIHLLLPELAGLTGIRFSSEAAESDAQRIELELKEPARVFVGFGGRGESTIPGNWAAPSKDWGFYANESLYLYKWRQYHMARCDVYMKELPAGRSVLSMGPGAFVVLGFAKRDTPLLPNAHRVIQPGLWFTYDFTNAPLDSPQGPTK